MPKPLSQPNELIAFISSTYIDLKEFRDKVEEALSRIDAPFRSMKFFGSKEGDPLNLCLSKVGQSNYYIGIVGHRYGHIHNKTKKSITELEYEEAKRLKMSRRVYIASGDVKIRPEYVESDKARRLLDAFKRKLQAENAVVWFSSPDDLATKVLADIKIGVPQTDEIAAFVRDKFLPAARTACASISFLGLDIRSMKRHGDVKLDRVYVKSEFTSAGNTGKASAVVEPGVQKQLFEEKRTPRKSTLTVEDLLLTGNNLVILGDPGSGKTTLAKYLVVHFADKAKHSSHGGDGSIPARVPLRMYAEYREQIGGIGASILDFLKRYAKSESQCDAMPEGFFESYLERKKAVLIFDGLDEIFNSHLREQVKNEIVAFTQVAYPGNKVVVTSRKFGYEEASFPEPEFMHFQILPFNAEQIAEYVNKWYRLEETDRRKRKEEMAGFNRASGSLPQELLTNPLLLSLIVILFRSGCTLPESKLEIYRSCVGTLTEKWDAAGKRLELPPEYNLVRDKKAAFARMAYWMYTQMTKDGLGQSEVKYGQIVSELVRFLREREFAGREAEAQQAAESFLEYAAKRSVFIEDRFSHKTFHEYFAALYLYSTFCLGRTPDELFGEIRPYLSSDNWAVALELLFLMIDEQSAPLLESVFERIVSSMRVSPDGSYGSLLVPLVTAGELQNVVPGPISSLIGAAVEFCVRPESIRATGGKVHEDAPHQKVYGILSEVPEKFLDGVTAKVRELALATKETPRLVSIGAFCAEESRPGWPKVEGVIPEWDSVKGDLARHHMGIFFASFRELSIVDRLRTFVSLHSREELFKEFPLVYHARGVYVSIAYSAISTLQRLVDEASYQREIHKLLRWDLIDDLLEGLISRDAQHHWSVPYSSAALPHLVRGGDNAKTHLLDWLVLARSTRSWIGGSTSDRRSAVQQLRGAGSKPGKAQSFYAALLLGTDPPAVSPDDLALGPSLFGKLMKAADNRSKPRG